jgi:hypothetical protein
VLGRSVKTAQHGSHHAAIITPLVWPVLARLSVDERRHRHGVAIAEATDDGPVAIDERSENKLEFGVIPQRSCRAKCSVESGEGRVGIRRSVEVHLKVVDGDEATRATSVARSPVVTPKADGQVLELGIAQTPAVFQDKLQFRSVEVSWLGQHSSHPRTREWPAAAAWELDRRESSGRRHKRQIDHRRREDMEAAGSTRV